MIILGLTGVAGSGKTTLANILDKNYGWSKTKFATPLKTMLMALFLSQGADPEEAYQMIDGNLKEAPTKYLNGYTPRHAMQTLGTEWRNLIHRDLWIDAWRRNVSSYSPDTKIVVDDLRFPHEAQAIRELGGKIVLITRPYFTQTISSHSSETEMAEIVFDGLIINDAEPSKMIVQLEFLAGVL